MSNTTPPLLHHENVDAHRVAIELLALSVELLDEIPKEQRDLRLQPERAAMSFPPNIAEGAGKPSPADRAPYHGIARGSEMECTALLDVSRIMGAVQSTDVEQGERLLSRLGAMLMKMCRSPRVSRTRTRRRTNRRTNTNTNTNTNTTCSRDVEA